MIRQDDLEFERRFLVSDTSPLKEASGERIEQGYLWAKEGYAIRVRLTESQGGDEPIATFTLKGPRLSGMRFEIEQTLDILHARALFKLCSFRVSKVRYPIVSENETWEVDVFEGANQGLVIAEFEASRQAVGAITKPWWCSEEVTADRRYDNENLAKHPWSEWGTDPASA